MPDFPIHTIESAPQSSRRLLDGLKEQLGFIPNLAATMAQSPTLLALAEITIPVLAGSVCQIASVKLDDAFRPQARRARHEAEEGGRSWTDVG